MHVFLDCTSLKLALVATMSRHGIWLSWAVLLSLGLENAKVDGCFKMQWTAPNCNGLSLVDPKSDGQSLMVTM
jgi:hypothetical protein